MENRLHTNIIHIICKDRQELPILSGPKGEKIQLGIPHKQIKILCQSQAKSAKYSMPSKGRSNHSIMISPLKLMKKKIRAE